MKNVLGISVLGTNRRKYACQFPSPTDEEDGEGDEEQEDVGNEVESVHEAAIVQHAVRHVVGIEMVVIAAKRQGHATTRLLHTSLESVCENKNTHVSLNCIVCYLVSFFVHDPEAVCVTSIALA